MHTIQTNQPIAGARAEAAGRGTEGRGGDVEEDEAVAGRVESR